MDNLVRSYDTLEGACVIERGLCEVSYFPASLFDNDVRARYVDCVAISFKCAYESTARDEDWFASACERNWITAAGDDFLHIFRRSQQSL